MFSAAALAAGSLALPVHAATNTLTDTADGSSWNTPANWSSGLAPAATDQLLLDGGSSLTSALNNAFTVQTLSFDTASNTIQVNANGTGTTGRILTLTGGTSPLGNATTLIDTGSATTGTINIGSTSGVGTLTLATVAGNVNVANSSANLVLGTSSLLTGSGTITKTGSGTLTIAGTNTGLTGGLGITGGTVNLTGQLSAGSSQTAKGVLLNAASGQTATFNTGGTIGVGTTFTGNGAFIIGNTAGGTGIFNMTGGFIRTQASGSSPAAREIWAGNHGFGVANISGGTIDMYGYLVGGIGASGATGIWNISNGTVNIRSKGNSNFAGTLGASANTTGVMNVTGTGTFNSVGLLDNGATSASATPGLFVGEAGRGILNLSGTGAVNLGNNANAQGLIIGKNNVATASGTVNLGAVGAGGGTLTTNRVQKTGAAAAATFNFHGGTLKAATGIANATFMTGLTGVYVYGEGGTIDNNAQNITIGQALLAPTGQGIDAISMSGLVTTGYTTAPLVTITGGSGTGMTANATVDANGNLMGFVVTNPGTGYSAGDTPTVTLSGGGKNTTSSSTSAIALADNVSGGLTFGGSGVTTLSGINTYTGNTNVSGGTLNLGNDAGLTFVIGADDVNNRITGTGSVSLAGDFTFDLTAASATPDDSWTIVDGTLASRTFTDDFTVAGFTPVGSDLWTSGVYQFSEATGVLEVAAAVPEPTSLCLVGLATTTLLARRRRT